MESTQPQVTYVEEERKADLAYVLGIAGSIAVSGLALNAAIKDTADDTTAYAVSGAGAGTAAMIFLLNPTPGTYEVEAGRSSSKKTYTTVCQRETAKEPVALEFRDRDRVLATTVSNRNGEFRFQLTPPLGDLHHPFEITLPGGKRLEGGHVSHIPYEYQRQ